MNLNDLISIISNSDDVVIEVKRVSMKHGNAGSAGDYSIIILTLKDQVLRFRESPSGWIPE